LEQKDPAMSVEIIALEMENGTGKPAIGLLNWKLNDVLLSSSSIAVVSLPASCKPDSSLLEFLARWSECFAAAHKRLCIVAEKRGLAQRIQAVNPDYRLDFLASAAELDKTTPPPAGHAHQINAQAEMMAVGATVIAAAEYVCKACGKSRMWLKGDFAAACDNLECPNAQAGWQIMFELF
jgi:hypothetical protein